TIITGYSLSTIGTDWQLAGLGRFFGSDTTDMVLRNGVTGGFEVYDISDNNITHAAFLGSVGLDWELGGFGDFNHDGSTDMVLRNSSTGVFQVYDILDNAITSSSSLGAVGLNWQVGGFGDFNGAGTTDMVLRNINTGEFEVYDIANNMITSAASLGAVGLDWQLGGFAVDPPTASSASMGDASEVAQLAQAMAGFGGGAADTSNAVVLDADTSQQSLLTTPQPA